MISFFLSVSNTGGMLKTWLTNSFGALWPESAAARTGGLQFPAAEHDASWQLVLFLLLIPILFNSIALFPEVHYSTPAGNDLVFHHLFIERANQALSAGDNPFDHWLPELELGFPQFFYYQNLPHLAVVALYRLLFGQVGLLRLLNLVRYLLMVGFPLTVYWSMRKMEFSRISAASGAAVCSLLSSTAKYGFDFRSYIWAGGGMFPQLCAMHLMFIATAGVWAVLERGKNIILTVMASSALILCDFLYGYMFAVVVLLVSLLSILRHLLPARSLRLAGYTLGRSVLLLAMVFVPVGIIIAYQVISFFEQIQYLNLAAPRVLTNSNSMFAHDQFVPMVTQFRYSSLTMISFRQLALFFGGSFFDANRVPVITCIVIVGLLYGGIIRLRQVYFAVAVLALWMILLVPNRLRGLIAPLMPVLHIIPMFRFVGGVDFGAILVAGLGGECLWRLCGFLSPNYRRALGGALLLCVFAPILVERSGLYSANTEGIESTYDAVQEDSDLQQVLSELKKLPPGRVYAGSRGNWGNWLGVGVIHVYDLLPIEQLATVMPWQTLSLNAPLLWQLNVPNQELCRLFNIRYVIASPMLRVPDFYRLKLSTHQYTLYEIQSDGYAQLGRIVKVARLRSSEDLFRLNREWMAGPDPAQGKFIAFRSGADPERPLKDLADPSFRGADTQPLGTISDETVTPDSLSVRVKNDSDAILALKTTYHPNWHVTVDGHAENAFMLSPSYIGVALQPGMHLVKAEYKSSVMKKTLLLMSSITVISMLGIGVIRRGKNRAI